MIDLYNYNCIDVLESNELKDKKNMYCNGSTF